MKNFEIILIVLAIVLIATLIGATIQALAYIVYWPIWFLFELYGGIL